MSLIFLEKYAHQGALHNAWTYVIMKKVGLLGYTITQNNEYKCTFNIDYIENNIIKITAVFPFQVISCKSKQDVSFLTLPENIAFFFQSIFKFPQSGMENKVYIYDTKIGILNASITEISDKIFLNCIYKSLEEIYLKYDVSKERIVNDTDFIIFS